jgi:CubicO group peptidase (beta-lactamase class C family)
MPNRGAVVARIDSIVNAALAAPFSGFSVAVVKGRDTLMMKGYGSANIELGVPATPATVYRIGSVTKQFTSSIIMQLVEQGKIGLEDPLSKYRPNVPAHWRAVTIHHLLNHTSGIPSYTDVGPRVRNVFVTGAPRDTLIALLYGDSLMFAPGTGFYYNNTGYYLLGMLIEQITGKSYAANVADLVKPLGLQRTMYCSTTPLIPGRASGYDRQGNALVNAAYVDMDVPYAAGSICSTAGDLVAWSQALASGKVVRPESYRTMTTPVKLPSVRPMTYGFGLTADTLGPRRVVAHGGNVNGFAAGLMFVPDDSLYVAVLSNTSSAPSSRIATDIARAVLSIPRVAVAPRDQPVQADERAAMLGRYSVTQPDGTKREASIVEQDGHLALSIPGQPAMVLQRQEGPVFTVRGQAGIQVFFEMSGGRVTGFILDRGSRPLPARRIP